MHEGEIDRLRTELVHLDATMRLFDPDTDPDDIMPGARCRAAHTTSERGSKPDAFMRPSASAA